MSNKTSDDYGDQSAAEKEQTENLPAADSDRKDKKERSDGRDKKKKKRNFWPLKAMIISLLLAVAVNAVSEIVLEGAMLWLSITITFLIVFIGVVFDVIGTATTACDVEPFLSMASRKVRGAKTAVRLAKKSDAVSSVCCDIVGDVCGIVSGVCAATIVASLSASDNLLWSILTYAAISTLTITLKAVGKGYAVNNANGIVMFTAKFLSIFNKNG